MGGIVAPHRAARTDLALASDAILSLLRIDSPTQAQRIGALLVGEFVIKANGFLPMPKKG